MRLSQKDYKRIVVKIGSSLLYKDESRIDSDFIKEVTRQVSDLAKEHVEVVIVSSGAIALGMRALKLKNRPKELSFLQAAAAVGQHELMRIYQRSFEEYQLNCAQLLLTWDDFDNRKRYLNAKNTLFTLLDLKTIPVINENDTVSTEEIRFGDNDRLSALVSTLINAQLLLILSDIDGLMDKEKKQVIKMVDKITPQIKSLACSTTKKTCVGGMVTKLEAARITTHSGIPCVIANGRKKDIIISAVNDPHGRGTLFLPQKECLTAKKRWLAFSAKPKGKIIVDNGAKEALMNKKSLLSVGIIAVEGDFAAGDIVGIKDKDNHEFARGKVKISSNKLDAVKGLHFEKEIVHRDDIAIL